MAIACVLLLAAAAALFVAGWQRRAAGPSATRAEDPTFAPRPEPGSAVFYYVSEDGMTLVEESRELPASRTGDTLTQARAIAEQQLAEPPRPLLSPFPAGTRLRAVYLTPTGDAFVDLSADVSREHPGGSLDELFTVYAMVNALTVNIPEISAVQILIEGREVDTLAGHVDLRHPLEPSLKWVRRRQGGSPSAQ